MQFLTDFADEALVLPLVFAVGGALFVLGWRRGAAAWIVAAVATLGALLVFKILGIACGPPHLRTPSGHTAAAAIVAGGMVALLAPRFRCASAGVAALLAGAVIGGSRLALGVHTLPEVLVGLAAGFAGALGFAWLSGPPPPRLRLRWVAVTIVVVALLLHGRRLHAESHIWHVAYRLSRTLHVCRGAPGWDQQRPYVSSKRMMSSSPR